MEIILDYAFKSSRNQEKLNIAYAAQDLLIEIEKLSGENYFKAFILTQNKNFSYEFESYKINSLKK